MAKPVLTLKVEQADLDRWLAWASEHGLNRTELIHQAVESFIAGVPAHQAQASAPAPASRPPAATRAGVTTSAQAKRGIMPITPVEKPSKTR